jgi:hypothetical protein
MNVQEQMAAYRSMNEERLRKELHGKAEALKDWDSVRLPILQELKKRGKDIQLKRRKK